MEDLPAWPAGVPHMPSDWTVPQPYRPNRESEVQSGKIRSRRVVTRTIAVVQETVKMTRPEFEAFKAFVRDALGNGVSEFTKPQWDGSGCPTRTARLRNGGVYSSKKVGAWFMVSYELDVYDL